MAIQINHYLKNTFFSTNGGKKYTNVTNLLKNCLRKEFKTYFRLN